MAKNVLAAAKIDAAIKRAEPTKLRDGEGLVLSIDKHGARWSFHFTSPEQTVEKDGKRVGRRREMGLGKHVSLAIARKLADEARELVATGVDPIEEAARQKSAGISFKEIADKTLKIISQGWSTDQGEVRWNKAMDRVKSLWNSPVRSLTTQDVKAALDKIDAPTARRFTQLCLRRVFDTAIAEGAYTGHNPAEARIIGKLTTLKHKGGHNKALPWAEVPAFVKWLSAHTAPSAKCLELIIRTGVRKREALEMTWEEIDFDSKVWTIPAERTKQRREHTVPLTDAVIKLLEDAQERARGWAGGTARRNAQRAGEGLQALTGYVWTGGRGNRSEHLSHGAFIHILKDGITVHGFRSSLRQFLGDCTTIPWEIAEGTLGHLVGDSTVRAYRRSTDLERRREALELWEKHLAGSFTKTNNGGNVIEFKEISNG